MDVSNLVGPAVPNPEIDRQIRKFAERRGAYWQNKAAVHYALLRPEYRSGEGSK